MGNTCTICRHEEREAIEAELQRGHVLDRIAEQYGTSKSALHRHKQDCLPFNLTTAGALSLTEGPEQDPLARIEKLLYRLERMIGKVEKPGKAPLFYQGAREIVRAAELLERMKAHYGQQYQTEQERRMRAEPNPLLDELAKDPVFIKALQRAVEETEAHYEQTGQGITCPR